MGRRERNPTARWVTFLLLSAFNLLFYVLAKLPWESVLDTVADVTLLVGVLKIASQQTSQYAIASEVFFGVLTLTAFYTVFSDVLPSPLRERRSAVVLFTLVTFGFTQGISGLGKQTVSGLLFNRGMLLFGVGVIAIGAFLGGSSINRSPSNDKVFSILDLYVGVKVPTDLSRLRRSPSTVSRLVVYVWWVIAIWLLMFFSAIVGIVTAIAWLFAPIPELVVIASALLKLGAMYDLFDLPASVDTFDIEAILRSRVRSLFWSSKGVVSIAAIILGLIYSVLPFVNGQFGFILTVRLPFIAVTDLQLLREFPALYLEHFTIFWSQAGSRILPVVAGMWSLWYWLQVLRRLPAFVAEWNAKREIDVPRVAVQLPRRPNDFLIVPALLWIGPYAYSEKTRGLELWYLDAVHGIVWTAVVIGVGLLFVVERRREPQPPMTDAYAVPLALAVQTASVATMEVYYSLSNSLYLLVFPVVISGALVTLFFVPDLVSIAREADTVLPALIIVPTVSTIVACLALSQRVPLTVTMVLYAAALVAALAGIAEIVTLKRFGVSSGSLVLMTYTVLFLLVALESFLWSELSAV